MGIQPAKCDLVIASIAARQYGFRVLRFTHRQVVERTAVVAALRPLLGQRSLAPNL